MGSKKIRTLLFNDFEETEIPFVTTIHN
jgi:hypothetical protein